MPARLSTLTLVAASLLTFAAAGQNRVPVPPAPPPADEEPEPTFEIHAFFRTDLPYDGSVYKARPDTRLALGVGLRDAEPAWIDHPVLAHATSDDEGLARVVLELPERWRGNREARIWARVDMEGFASTTGTQTLRTTPAEKPQRISVYTGETRYGRVVDEGGRPVKRAGVYAYSKRGDKSYVKRTETHTDGRFAARFPAGEPEVLHARLWRSGSAVLDASDFGGEAEPIELTLRGGRELSGRVLDGGGVPIAGLRVFAVARGGDRLLRGRTLVEKERQGGIYGHPTITDPQGRFAFAELIDTEYALYGTWSTKSVSRIHGEELGERLGTVTLGPDTKPLTLELAQHRIEVRVTDYTGAPVELTEAELEVEGDDPPELRIAPLRDGRVDSSIRSPRPRMLPDGRVLYLVEPETEYVVAWHDARQPYQEVRVFVSATREHSSVELRLAPPTEPTQVTLRFLAPDGNPAKVLPDVYVRSAETGQWLYGDRTVRGTGEMQVELPPGRFHVEANPRIWTEFEGPECTWTAFWPNPAEHLPASAEIDVLPGSRDTFTFRLGAAGHVSFESLEHVTLPGKLELYRTPDPDDDLERFGGARITLHDEEGGRVVEELRFGIPYEQTYTGIDWLVPGWSGSGLTPIPPGTWTLRAANEDGVLFEREITIEQGRTTLVRW